MPPTLSVASNRNAEPVWTCPRCHSPVVGYVCRACGLLTPRAIEVISKVIEDRGVASAEPRIGLPPATAIDRERLRLALEETGVFSAEDVRALFAFMSAPPSAEATPTSASSAVRPEDNA